MDWIKRNYDQFILALVALVLLVLSALLITKAVQFQQTFAGIQGQVVHHNQIPPADMSSLQQATEALANPAKWELNADEGSLFISIPYIARGDELIDPRKSPTPLHPPIPNKWIIDHKLDILDNNVLNEDPDGDGFSNLDEWKGVKGDGSDSTDPNDPKSHPPYYTKLRLVQYIKQPFRLLFNAWDGDVKKPETLEFQINTVDVHQPTQFVKIGDQIAGTKFKVLSFESKTITNKATGSTEDVSELTVQNVETHDKVLLIMEKIADSPDSYALFHYLWNNTQFEVKKDKEFALLPDANLRYKLIDITEKDALIQTPTGPQVRVPHLDEPWTPAMFTPSHPAQPSPQPAAQPAAQSTSPAAQSAPQPSSPPASQPPATH